LRLILHFTKTNQKFKKLPAGSNHSKVLKRFIFFLQTPLALLRISRLLAGINILTGFLAYFFIFPDIIPYPIKSNFKPNRVFFGVHFHVGGDIVSMHPFP
jgi:hypothetical protein